MEGELHTESIFCDAQLLTMHMLSAKGPTLNCDSSVCFGRASFVDRSKNRRKDNVMMKLFVWLLQRVTEMVRNLVLIVSWSTLRSSWLGIFRIVGVLSYKIFAMVVACKKQGQRETILDDQRDMDIGKAADPLVESEYVCGELKTKTPSVSSLTFRERTLCTKCKASEGLCAKAKDFKLMCWIDGNNYLKGTRCSENDLLKSVRSRYCIFECSGGYESVTGRRKFRRREPSRISSRVKIGMQKNRKIRCLFRRKVLGAVPRSSILNKFRKSSIRKEHVCFKYFFGLSAKKEKRKKEKRAHSMLNKRRKRVVFKNCCEVFTDKNHQSLYKNIKLCNDIESNPGPVYVNESCTVTGSFHQGNEELFEINAGKQCVVNSLVAIIFNATASCFAEAWNSTKMDNILRVGNGLYSYIHLSIKEDLLLL